ncbi:MAG: ACP S-malonyltransferase [Gammaproteobacteria bacterium]|nr:ACP S-malonyltransferase [Gammaproteobacteria bacterium]
MTTAFIFPGQGSQSVGMMNDLAAEFPIVQATFDAASEALDKDLWSIVQHGPEEEINRTEITQPIMLCAGYATWQVWREKGGVTPDVLAGHSLGEYTALVVSGAMKFTDAVSCVAERARLMQTAVPLGEGAMAAIIGLDDDAVKAVCKATTEDDNISGIVEAVNFNAPGQVVIAGNTLAVDAAMIQAKQAGAKRAIQLPVSVPSHCQLMKPAAEELLTYLLRIEISPPAIPILHNVTGATAISPNDIKYALSNQLYLPVIWVKSMKNMIRDGVTQMVECGPGKVLTGLNKRIDRSVPTAAIINAATLEKTLKELS